MTLTEMLVNCDTHLEPDQINATKEVFKEWLRTVGLPDHFTIQQDRALNATMSTRKLLITLVDEPS